jgi:DNA-binding NarL/FixJ family response regulator
MGVHSVRARSARQAEKVIRTVPVHIAVVDLGLPLDECCSPTKTVAEEAGPRVLDLLARLDAPPPTVVVKGTRTARDTHRELAAALRSGAFAVVDRGSVDVELMLEVLRRCLHRFYRGRWPGGNEPPGASGADDSPPPRGGPPTQPTRRHWCWFSMG